MTTSNNASAQPRGLRRRLGLAALAVGLVAAPIAAVGSDTTPDTEPTYTGCLDGTGADAGRIYAVATGLATLKPCDSGDKQLAVSAGDLTSIAAGVGLRATSGGAFGISDTQGDVSLDLAPGYRLPQSCATGSPVIKAASGWQCTAFPAIPAAHDRILVGTSRVGEDVNWARVSDDWANVSDPLGIPAGDWHVTATLSISNGDDYPVWCRLDSAGATWVDDTEPTGDMTTVVLQSVVSSATPFTAAVACRDSGDGGRWQSLHIVAAEASGVTARNLVAHE